MKKEKKIAFKITILINILIIFSVFISFFLFSNFNSIFDFLANINKELNKNFYKFLNFLFALVVVFFWTYFIIKFFLEKHFLKVEEYNKNLKDYNHYLAHELKTPISVVFSNLEVLKYGFDENIVKKSQIELKNIIWIIDTLLSFSESLNISQKEEFNLENFLKSFIKEYFLENKENIFIKNNEFNFYIKANKILFKRIILNLIENALKYSIDWKIFLKIENKKLIFENKINKTLEKNEIKKLFLKFYRKDNWKNWYGLWLPMIKEIIRFLWFDFLVYSKDEKFFVEIIFEK